MRKSNVKITAVLLTAALAVYSSFCTGFAEDTIKILVNGSELNIPEGDTRPFIENDRTLVPMRAIFEALGAEVEWDGAARRVTARDPAAGVTVVLDVDSKTMLVNDEPVELDVSAKIVNDRTVVPVRAIAEGMKCSVDWDGETKTVIVEKSSEITEIPALTFDTPVEINEYIQKNSENAYTVPDISHIIMDINGYNYYPADNSTVIFGEWTAGEGSMFSVGMVPGSARDIWGDFGEKTAIKLMSGAQADMYTMEDGVKYTVWENNGYTFCVSLSAANWDTSSVVEYLANRIDTKAAPADNNTVFGEWADSVSGRAYMTVEPGMDNKTVSVLISWGNGAASTIQWSMSCEYDADKNTLIYDNGSKWEMASDDNGDMGQNNIWSGSAGSFELRDGIVYWKDSKEENAAECRFIKEI